MSKIAATKGTRKPTIKSGTYRASGGVKVKFGSVVVTTAKPERSVVAANIVRSSEALERVAKKLVKPGFTVRARQDVPRFSVASDDIKIFIRELNGRTDRGRFVDGRFEVVD